MKLPAEEGIHTAMSLSMADLGTAETAEAEENTSAKDTAEGPADTCPAAGLATPAQNPTLLPSILCVG